MKPSPEALFERHHARVYQYFRRVTGRPDAAEDLTQDLFLRVVRAWPTYEAVGHEAEWVFRVARHLALDYQRGVRAAIEPPAPDTPAWTADPPHVVAFGVAEALSLVGEADRDALLLHDIVGLRYDEVAALLQTTATALSQRLYRVRQRLRQILGPRSRFARSDRRNTEG